MSDKRESIFEKVIKAGEVQLDRIIAKGKADIVEETEETFYRKSVYQDQNHSSGALGYHDKTYRLSFQLQKQMAHKDVVVGSIIKTYQNIVSSFTKYARNNFETGFRIVLKDEKAKLDEILLELNEALQKESQIRKSETTQEDSKNKAVIEAEEVSDLSHKSVDTDKDGVVEQRELERRAKQILAERTEEKAQSIKDFILEGGYKTDRPFESKRWDFTSILKALVFDSLAYDILAIERIYDAKGDLHHIVPIDAATFRFASPQLGKASAGDSMTGGYDILYPEKELEKLKESDALNFDEDKLEKGEYRYVQVVRGNIQRAFTESELAVGMRNPVTDIYANGYSLSEMEMLIPTITSHLFTENYYRSFYTNGFSAKGILHIEAPISQRKLETIRLQWKHMVSGGKNSFQTPIMAGMKKIEWIPLNNSADPEKENLWMNYLIKAMCSVYQIDPKEIGFGIRDEGTGGGLSGDDTKEKLKQSKAKGLVPLLRFIENFINKEIIDLIDPDYELEFVGVTDESGQEALNRQKEEIKFKKTVNEIRAEENLPPIPGADELILEPTYFQWFTQFHPDGKKLAQQNQQMQDFQTGAESATPEDEIVDFSQSEDDQDADLGKAIKIEYYRFKDES